MNGTSHVYDVLVLEAGPTGESLAERTSAAGLTSVIVENDLLGGECSFWACEPSKALLRPVLARADARRVPGLRRAVEGPLDVPAVFAHRDRISAYWHHADQVDWLRSVSVDLVRGHGRLGRTAAGGGGRLGRWDRTPVGPACRRCVHRDGPRLPRSAGTRAGASLDEP